jgi:hypothetical protein
MADMVNFKLRLGVPRGDVERSFFGLAIDVRVTTLHLLIGGAIAAGVLYLVGELGKTEKQATVEAADRPTPITRGA